MTFEMRRKAIIALLVWDRIAKNPQEFTDAWVVGRHIFFTKEAASGWPRKPSLFLERVQKEEAFQYAHDHPEIMEFVHNRLSIYNRH